LKVGIFIDLFAGLFRTLWREGRQYMELGCCLSEFDTPNIMDIKMGVRTFLTSESRKGKPRSVFKRISSESV
jgi:hypothetical protein